MSEGFEHWCRNIYNSISWLFFYLLFVSIDHFLFLIFQTPRCLRNQFMGKTMTASVPFFSTTRGAWLHLCVSSSPAARGQRLRRQPGHGGG
jgi:hypothetical protein